MRVLDEKFKQAWPSYIFQSLLATITLIIVLLLIDLVAEAAIVAALGATAFIVFAMPKSITARPKNVIGGHAIGLISGSLCFIALTPLQSLLGSEGIARILAAAVSVGLSIFLMTIIDMEHPPASGTALGIVVYGWASWIVLFVLVCAAMLSIAKYLLKPWLRDLV